MVPGPFKLVLGLPVLKEKWERGGRMGVKEGAAEGGIGGGTG